MANLNPTQIPNTGLDVTAALTAASAGGDVAVISDDRCFLRVKNASGSSINVTLAAPGTDNGQARPNRVVAVPATTGDKLIPLPLNYVDPSIGGVGISYSAATSVTVQVVRA
jgi:hypothetical protein